jgi:hypothetical protein
LAKDIFLLGCCDHSSFSLCFSSSCAHSNLSTLLVKHLPIERAVRAMSKHLLIERAVRAMSKHLPIERAVKAMSQTVTHYTMTSVFFLRRTNVLTVANKLNYIFLSQLQLSNEKWLSIQHETRPHFNGFPFSCCDDKSLMERCSKLVSFYKKKIRSLGCINGPSLWKFTSVSVTTWFT